MTYNDLVKILTAIYDNADAGEKVLEIHLFGIKYANEIRNTGESIHQFSIDAGLGKYYGSEISKGMKLANHVQLCDTK